MPKVLTSISFGFSDTNMEIDSRYFHYQEEYKPINIFELNEDKINENFDFPTYESYEENKRLVLIKNKENYGYAGGIMLVSNSQLKI